MNVNELAGVSGLAASFVVGKRRAFASGQVYIHTDTKCTHTHTHTQMMGRRYSHKT